MLTLVNSIPGQFPKTSKLGGLPNHIDEPMKLLTLGTMLNNEVECESGAISRNEIVQKPEQQSRKKCSIEN